MNEENFNDPNKMLTKIEEKHKKMKLKMEAGDIIKHKKMNVICRLKHQGKSRAIGLNWGKPGWITDKWPGGIIYEEDIRKATRLERFEYYMNGGPVQKKI